MLSLGSYYSNTSQGATGTSKSDYTTNSKDKDAPTSTLD
jgi:hypothetical protein